MRILRPRTTIDSNIEPMTIMKALERAGRGYYGSGGGINTENTIPFIRDLVQAKKHYSIFEHQSITVRFQIDRGITHKIVRHSIGAAYSQESTRYCDYDKNKKEISVIAPISLLYGDKRRAWETGVRYAEATYLELIEAGSTPQCARSVLPHCLKAEIYVTYSLQGWRNFFDTCTASSVHSQVKEVARPLLAAFRRLLPEIFEDTGNASSPYKICPECKCRGGPIDGPRDSYPDCLTCQWVGGYRPRMDWIQLVNEEDAKCK
jgi:thymidylate synthase (FAD)